MVFFFPSLFVLLRIFVKIFGHPTLLFGFFNFSVHLTIIYNFFTLCVLPPFLLFFYLFKKPKIFFAKLFVKNKNLLSFFLLIGRLELAHFNSTFFGFVLFFTFIALYTLLFIILTPLFFEVLFLIIKYVVFWVLLYLSFRGCFLSPYNVIMRQLFTDFNNLSNKVQESQIAKNRIFFLQFDFLFCLIVVRDNGWEKNIM